MLKVRTLFSGIGSPESALKNIGIDYELVDFCEIDKYAVKSYCAIHNVSEDKNLGDISKVWGRNLPYADLMVWGFPCTDISLAGKQSGIIEGETRSGLNYEGFRVLKETKPKYSIIENVKNLTGKKFKGNFDQMLIDIEELGYNNYWEVLNSKDYGIPQNRERVFIVCIRSDIDTGNFVFPEKFDSGYRLKDFLEDEVDESFYISQDKVDILLKQLTSESVGINPCLTPGREEKRQQGRRFKEDGDPAFTINTQDRHGVLIQLGMLDIKGNEQIRRVYSEEGLSPTLNTMAGGNRQPKVLTNNIKVEGNIYGEYNPQAGRVYNTDHIGPSLNAAIKNNGQPIIFSEDYRIRGL